MLRSLYHLRMINEPGLVEASPGFFREVQTELGEQAWAQGHHGSGPGKVKPRLGFSSFYYRSNFLKFYSIIIKLIHVV